MSEAVVDDVVAVLPPLLQTLESLSFVARNLNPPEFDRVMQIAGEPDEALQAVKPRLADWPEKFAHIKTRAGGIDRCGARRLCGPARGAERRRRSGQRVPRAALSCRGRKRRSIR